jgi:hypothetical protein
VVEKRETLQVSFYVRSAPSRRRKSYHWYTSTTTSARIWTSKDPK